MSHASPPERSELLSYVCVAVRGVIRFLSPRAAKPTLQKQVVMFKDKHTWWMTYLYIMTFGPTSARRLPRSRVRDTH